MDSGHMGPMRVPFGPSKWEMKILTEELDETVEFWWVAKILTRMRRNFLLRYEIFSFPAI